MGITLQGHIGYLSARHFNWFILGRKHSTLKHKTSQSAGKFVLMVFVAISISAVFFMPQHAFSTLTFTDYSNGTSTTGTTQSQTSGSTNTGTTSSAGTASNTTQTSGSTNTGTTQSSTTSTTQSTPSNQTSSTTGTTQSQTSGSTNTGTTQSQTSNSTSHQTSSNSTGISNTVVSGANSTSSKTSSNANSTSNSNSTQSSTTSTTQSTPSNQTSSSAGTTSSTTQTNNSITLTSSNSTNVASVAGNQSTSQASSESSTPAPVVEESSGGSDLGSDSITIVAPTTASTETSASNESEESPSIAISGITNSSAASNSSAVSSATIYTGAPILPPALLLTNDQAYYAYGDVVTLQVALPGLSLQNIAIVVSDPTGNDIVSRTVTTDENGTGELQFKIPSNFQTGVYQDIATALVDGRNYTNATTFNVIKAHGISIDSVQLTNQQGNPVSMLKEGQNNFVQVLISSDQKMPALITLNLFDTNQSSIGTASINSTINPGDSNMTLSFFIPPSAQVGTANIFTDAYSNWPSNGGTPLTPESCLSASLENPATLPVSYQPTPLQTCTVHPQNLTGTTLVSAASAKLTNAQAQVMLGIAIQNDTMTFMSPAQAQLLALAYQNGTAANTGNQSIALANLNLALLNSTGAVSNLSSGNVIQFTTLVGPSLQNDPMAQKILQEIKVSKQQVANILGNETAAIVNNELVQQQRVAAASQLKQDLTALQQSTAANTPSVAYSSFLSTIPNNATQGVFEGEFDFMQQRVSAANAAMQNVIANGGSLDQAMQTFDSYAAVDRAQVVQINDNLNVEYGLANSNVQSCFDSQGDLTVVNGTNPCIANLENNSTNSSGIQITSVQPTDQNGNPVSTFTRGQNGYVRVNISSSYTVPTLVTIDLFDSNLDTLGTGSAQYTLNPGTSEVVIPYYVPTQASTGLASIYANVLTAWPNKGGTSESHELSYFVGLL
jgi:trimeric autotransporter adhesin